MDDPARLEDLERQKRMDALTAIRRMKDEAQAIVRNLDLLADVLEDVEKLEPITMSLIGLLPALHDVEQRVLKISLLAEDDQRESTER